jgi:diadenosine tetraphosphatase ApaH/serine/threonine PP2A family protein phosphatase
MWFHNADWLDFNMFQSGHRRYDQDDTEHCYGEDNWRFVEGDYKLEPKKPTLDGEPSYEQIPHGLHDTTQPYWNDDDVRRYAYWSVFAGGCGYTYGHNAVMQFHKDIKFKGAFGVKHTWQEAMEHPGAGQMVYLMNLMLSKSYFDRIPDQSLIAGKNQEKYEHILATRGDNYAMFYTYTGRDFSVNMGILEGNKVKASWFSPKDGISSEIAEYENEGAVQFDPPGEQENGNDWVLILESL